MVAKTNVEKRMSFPGVERIVSKLNKKYEILEKKTKRTKIIYSLI